MRKSEAEEILTKMKQNYLNLDDLQKANALQFALNCLNDTDKDLTLVYLKGVADTKSALVNRLKEELDKQVDIVIIGGRGHSKIFNYGKILGRRELAEELLNGGK